MKKLFLTSFVMGSMALSSGAQNVQLHYDMGRTLYDKLDDRPKLTSTIEMFHLEDWGNTYFFVDMDYSHDGIQSAYWEISCELNLGKEGFAAHVEYDGGLKNKASYNNAYLLGPAFNGHSADFSKTYSIQLMYKYLQGEKYKDAHHSFQVTGVWGIDIAGGACRFDGFADLWYDKTVSGNLIFLSEPQFWVNLNKFISCRKDFNLSIGTEVEISNNFVYNTEGANNKFYAIPTIAAKWTF